MSNDTLDKLIWTLIYGGLLLLCLSLFVRRGDADFGNLLAGGGGGATALGVLLVWVRSRRAPPPDRPPRR